MPKAKMPPKRQRLVILVRETGKPSVAKTVYEVPQEWALKIAVEAIERAYPNCLSR